MKKTILVLILATVFLTAGPASAFEDYYLISGNDCFSTTSGEEAHYSQWGAGAAGTALDVTCPLMLTDWNFAHAYITVRGYNRSSSDHISCTISNSKAGGSDETSATAYLPYDSWSFQSASAQIQPTDAEYVSLMCHLPAYATGDSHLTSILVKITDY
ncbi:MAG TPA: hypothetical protein VJ385_10500 [Fibrobacteria bacterium]|nr:hypothetical protein [Fibrobacteria bacterium]